MVINQIEEINMRQLRQNIGLGMLDFANLAGVSLEDLKKIERNLALPNEEVLSRLESLFSIDKKKIIRTDACLAEEKTIGEGYVTALPKDQLKLNRETNLKNKIPILDLFCGVGGLSSGFENTAEFEVVAGIDLLGDRINTFQTNHKQADTYCWDIYDLDPKYILESSPSPQVVIGGPPCQGFSSLRPYRSLVTNDKRNNLFEQFAFFVSVLKPEWFVLENVIGLLNHDKGKTLKTLLSVFESIGYTVNYKAMNAAAYGLPQSRERVIFVGNRNNIKFEFPNPTHSFNFSSMIKNSKRELQKNLFNMDLPSALTIMEAINDLPKIPSGGSATHYEPNVELTPFIQKMRKNNTTLTLHEATLHSEKMLEIIRKSGSNISAVADLVTSGFSTSYSRLEADRPAVTLTVNFVHPSSNKCIHPFQDRALTPREGARLQSFPDDFKFMGTKTQIIKQIGNAVPPMLGEVIAWQLLKYL